MYLYLDSLLPLRYGAFYRQPGGLVPRARGRIPESTLSGDLKVHSAPGALTNVVRKGRGFGGNHATLIRGVRIPGSTLSGDLKVHKAPGALTNVVRKGRKFGGNHAASIRGLGIPESALSGDLKVH